MRDDCDVTSRRAARVFFFSVFLSLLAGSLSADEDVQVVVFLPRNDSYLFSYARVAPAVLYAQARLQAPGAPFSGVRFDVRFDDSDCANDAVFRLLERSCAARPDLILGPVCEYEAAAVVRLASHWNIPVITAGALAAAFRDKTGEFSHLTRIAPSYSKMAEVFRAIFTMFSWTGALLVYEDDKVDRDCYFTVEGIYHLMDDVSMQTYSVARRDHLDPEDVVQNMLDTQVIIFCMDANSIREIMLAAHRRRLTSGTHMFFNIELFNASSYGNGSWRRGDKMDDDARQAFAYLNTVTLLRTLKPDFENFSVEMKKASQGLGLTHCSDCATVNMFVEGFHDALLLYAVALHAAMKQGYTKKNGTQIISHMWNTTFEGIAGQVSVDANGDRNGDFSLMAMTDAEAGTYEVVANYFGVNESLELLSNFKHQHFTLEQIQRSHPDISDTSCGLRLSALTGVIVGTVLGTVMLIVYYFFRKNYRVSIERRALAEECGAGKHRQLREDSIRSHFSAA
ncbi:atrial natriuretic peptide receptor 3 isoform X1 [Entelurus aequoreus]|uniref:atrial natriuretic peptide receptor 3 isoform X1 n=1 Tax=Entelurus aequoreus TaxID=161455 RepID=UPI002B1CF231|nr:atrial natriuretic peptide receptor 3 isoform X1 [Entelurus aequoreus]